MFILLYNFIKLDHFRWFDILFIYRLETMQFTFALATIAAVAASVTASPVKRDGQATFYYGAGAAGSCGSSITDGDSVVAVAQSDMNSSNCGKSITVMNTSNGNTATATIQDT